tara:strand:+ start:33 stop:539 length:507 start_codon:yes stop_codon:yes gene_type:complete
VVEDSDNSKESRPISPKMKRWYEEFHNQTEKKDSHESNEENLIHSKPDSSDGGFRHKGFCKILICMSIIGGIFSLIGYAVGPDTCDNDSIFETVGALLFWISMLSIPINILIWLTTLVDAKAPSAEIFGWSALHILAVFLCMFIFGEFLLQDMFCNGGPGFYVTASPI